MEGWYHVNWKAVDEIRYAPGSNKIQKMLEEIRDILNKTFPNAKSIVVKDLSMGFTAMFEIFVESSEFRNMTDKMQLEKVYDVLKEHITQMHTLLVITKAI